MKHVTHNTEYNIYGYVYQIISIHSCSYANQCNYYVFVVFSPFTIKVDIL